MCILTINLPYYVDIAGTILLYCSVEHGKVGDSMFKDSLGNYEQSISYILDKSKAVDSFVRYMLIRTQAMFEYQGLPDTIPQTALEYLLQTKGSCFITEVEGQLYALSGSAGGPVDVYGEPTQYTVANTALNLSKTFDIATDGVLFLNDAFGAGLLPILQRYGALLTENTISMKTVLTVLRMALMISAPDDNTAASASKFIQDIENGKFSVIGESAFFDGVKVHSVANTQNYLLQFMELEQYIKATCFNEIGLDSQYNMKRANLTEKEVSKDDDALLPLVDQMIKQRQIALDAINEKYGLSITVDYASSWKIAHAENEKEIAVAESITEQVETGDTAPAHVEGERDDYIATGTDPDDPGPDEPGSKGPDSEGDGEPAEDRDGQPGTAASGNQEGTGPDDEEPAEGVNQEQEDTDNDRDKS